MDADSRTTKRIKDKIMGEKDNNDKFITKYQFFKIIDLFNSYIQKHNEVFPNNPLSNEFCQGLIRGVDLIEKFVITKE